MEWLYENISSSLCSRDSFEYDEGNCLTSFLQYFGYSVDKMQHPWKLTSFHVIDERNRLLDYCYGVRTVTMCFSHRRGKQWNLRRRDQFFALLDSTKCFPCDHHYTSFMTLWLFYVTFTYNRKAPLFTLEDKKGPKSCRPPPEILLLLQIDLLNQIGTLNSQGD